MQAMPITLDQGGSVCSIGLVDEITIASAVELKAVLLEALALRKKVLIDLGRTKELDITALQLLWAAEREARLSGNGFALATPMPSDLLLSVNEAGFESLPVEGVE